MPYNSELLPPPTPDSSTSTSPPHVLPQPPATPSFPFRLQAASDSPLPPGFSHPLLFPSCPWTPLLPRQILSLQTSASPSRASAAFPHLSLVYWAAGRKPFPPLSTLFPLVTPCTHGDYFFWQQVSSCQRDRSVFARRRQEGRWKMRPEWKRPPSLPWPETLRNGEVCIEATNPEGCKKANHRSLSEGIKDSSSLTQTPTSYPDKYHKTPLKHKQDAQRCERKE